MVTTAWTATCTWKLKKNIIYKYVSLKFKLG
jgi:hypothetical protein